MKIGFVLDDTLDSFDGVQQYILTLGKWMSANGHEVHYLVGETSRKDIGNIHSLAKNLKVNFNKNVLSIPLKADKKKIKHLLTKEKFDVIHVQLPFSPFMAGVIIDNLPESTALVGTFHILPYSKYQYYGAKALSKVTKNQYRKFNKILSVSPPAKEFAKTAMNIDSDVIPNAVDFGNFKTGKKIKRFNDEKTNLVFLGRLVKRKGCMELLEAYKYLVDTNKFENTRLIIAGAGPEQNKLRAYVSKNYLQNCVEFLGRVTEAEKVNLFATADVVVLPSLSGESFGIVVVEAIATGAGLVVAGSNPGYSYVLQSTPEVLVNPKDTDLFAELIAKSIEDKNFGKKIHKVQQASIKQFDVNVVGRDVVKVYKSVIANSSSKSDNG